MKFILTILLNIILVGSGLAQQQRPGNAKRIEALKAAFITKRLNLTPEEAQSFWPVYNQYQSEISGLYRQKRQNQLSATDNPKATLNTDLEFDARILDVKKKYQKEFSRVLPSQKVLALYQAEREFREELIKELRERRSQ